MNTSQRKCSFIFILFALLLHIFFALILSFVPIKHGFLTAGTWWRQFLLPTAGCQCFLQRLIWLTRLLLSRDSSGHPVPPGGEGRRWSRVVDRKDERLDVMRGNKIVLLEFTALTKNPGYFSVFFSPPSPSRPPSARQSTLLSVSLRCAVRAAGRQGMVWRCKSPWRRR